MMEFDEHRAAEVQELVAGVDSQTDEDLGEALI
jgi:hypothetical protein